MTTSLERPPPITNHLSKAPKFPQSNPNRGPARVNSDKRHGPKSSDSARNEIVTRDNLPWPNCDSDGKADNKSDKHLSTLTRDVSKFRQVTWDPPSPGRASFRGLNDNRTWHLYVKIKMESVRKLSNFNFQWTKNWVVPEYFKPYHTCNYTFQGL